METEKAGTILLDKPTEQKPTQPSPNSAEDEFNNTKLTFYPLIRYEGLDEKFSYYVRTRRLEIDTPRTDLLQQIVDKMTEGTETQVRVVIMNKGREKQAFVSADGTIFVYQTLINSLENLDELAGVLAHEVGHRINKTHERKGSQWRPAPEVGWIHEIGSDTLAPHLLEKAGFNSFGLSQALLKIGGQNRDFEHQTNLSRATQTTAQHIGIHFATSDQEFTPLPQILKTTNIPMTNQEIIKEISTKLDLRGWRQTLPLLHPQDLKEAYISFAKQYLGFENKVSPLRQSMIEAAIELFKDRLLAQGLSKEFIDLYFLTAQDSNMNIRTFSMIQSSQELVNAIENLNAFIDQEIFKNSQTGLFEDTITDRPVYNILENLADYLCEENLSPDPSQIPVTESVLLTVLEKIHLVNKEKNLTYSDTETRLMSKVIYSYISRLYKGAGSDKGKISQLILSVKNLDLPISREEIKKAMPRHSSADIDKLLLNVLDEIFPTEKTDIELTTEKFLKRIAESEGSKDQRDVWKKFLETIREMMDKDNLDDAKRALFLENLQQSLQDITLIVPDKFAERMHLNIEDQSKLKITEEAIYRLSNFELAAALTIFKADGKEFYDYVNRWIARSRINPNDLDWYGLANTLINLLNAPARTVLLTGEYWDDYVSSSTRVEINNLERLLSLPILQNLLRRIPKTSFSKLSELNKYINEFSRDLRFRGIEEIFDDSLPALLLSENLRRNAEELFKKGIKENEYDSLYEFISTCLPDGREKSRILRSIKHHILTSGTIGLDQKTDYIIRNFDDIGPDGMIEVAEQITTLADYRKFHDKLKDKITSYLEGSSRVTQLAAIDAVSSEFVGSFDKLILTTIRDSESAKKASNGLAGIWYRSLKYNPDAKFDKELKKVRLTSSGRQTFLSLPDLIDRLQNMTPLQRFAVALKALVDKDGAMANDENRKLLGETITKALRINSGFINSALMIACRQAPAEFFSLPAAQMISPMLFRNLNSSNVGKEFFDGQYIERNLRKDIGALLNLTTREATIFGAGYLKYPRSLPALAIKESDSIYRFIEGSLGKMFPPESKTAIAELNSEIDPSVEAIISGVESSGPLGARGLQLMRQLLEFSPAVDRRLARSLDRMKGLNKLLLWENTLKLITDAKAGRLNWGTNQPELIDFFERRLISLNEYLGGGSLYTTYAATILDSSGRFVDGVVKMLKPNPEVFIKTSYKTTSEILSEIEKSGSEKDQRYARMGQVFIDLAQQWCLKDILDTSFEQDDDQFKTSIAAYNKKAGREVFYSPDRLLTCFYVKSETEAEGKTLNQILEDPGVDRKIKRNAVGLVVDLFRHQLRTQLPSGYLIHSDPHVGNYIVDLNRGEKIRIGVIDRSMYLKLTSGQAKAFESLLSSGNYRSFISSFIDEVMDHNKVINQETRRITKNNILSTMTREYLSQKLRSIRKFSLDVDNFTLLRKMLEQFDQAKLDIPLEMRLMIKSVESLRELQRRY